jgi:hypothetical protein
VQCRRTVQGRKEKRLEDLTSMPKTWWKYEGIQFR